METSEIIIKDEPLDDPEYVEYAANGTNESLVGDTMLSVAEVKAEIEESDYEQMDDRDPLASDNHEQIVDDIGACDKGTNQINLNQHIRKNAELKLYTAFDTGSKCKSATPTSLFEFQCGVCLKKFKLQRNLEIHRKFSMCKIGTTPPCAECDRLSGGDKRLLRNKICCHIEQYPFKCKTCGEAFRFKLELKRHLNSNGNKCRNYVCECGLIFTDDNAFIRHYGNCVKPEKSHKKYKRKYTDEFLRKLLYCEICKSRTVQVDAFVLHMTYRHNETKPFQCDLCQSKFKTIEEHQAHHKTAHAIKTKYICHICDKEFSTHLLITEHMIMHQ